MTPHLVQSTSFLRRVLGALVVFAASAGAVAWGLRTWEAAEWPDRDIGPHSAHLRALAEDPAGGEVLVIGASRLLNGFAPRVFEAELAGRGLKVRAANLSLQRLQLWELEQVVEAALAVPGVRPRLVVLEPVTGLGVAPENLTHPRTLHFETPRAFALSVAAIRESGRPLWHQVWNVVMHGAALGMRGVGYGRWGAEVFGPPGGGETVPEEGYLALPALPDGAEVAAELVGAKERLSAGLAGWRAEAPAAPAVLTRHFDQLRAGLEARGIRVVYVFPPVLDFPGEFYRGQNLGLERHGRERMRAGGESEVWLSYLEVAENAELFDLREWNDRQHLRAPGAERFTRRLARDLERWLRLDEQEETR